MANRYFCPKCHQSTSLWEGVELQGWRAINDELEPTRNGYPDRDADWDCAQPTGLVGCGECGWEGRGKDLKVLGIGDVELVINPDQLMLESPKVE